MIDAAGGTLVVLLRFLALVATTGALGAWVFGRFVAGRLAGDAGQRHRSSLQLLSVRVGIWCSAALVISSGLRLLAQAAAFAEPGDPLWPSAMAVLQSRWGWALAVQALLAATACVALLWGLRTRRWPHVAEACIAGLAVVPAFLGHAGAAEEWRVLSVLIDFLHVLAAGGWVGALAMLTAAVLRARRGAEAPVFAAALVVAFHPVAMVAASTVFATGLATAWLRMGAPVGIASSSYSGLFVAKLLVVGVTGALGAGHSKLATRRRQVVGLTSVSRTLLTETLLAVLVLAITAILSGTDPIG